MRGIERVVAALLLAGAVASAVALPRLAAGPDSTALLGRFASSRATTVVEAAPLPAPKPKVELIAARPVLHAFVAAPRPRIAGRIQRAPNVPAVAPDVVQAPAPVATPTSPAQVATPSTPSPAAPTVSPAPMVPALGLGNGHGKGHDKRSDGATPIELPQVQAPPADNGNDKSHGHGHDKGA